MGRVGAAAVRMAVPISTLPDRLAGLTGWPAWPAMVDDDPDTGSFFWTEMVEDKWTDKPSSYHVIFFDKEVSSVKGQVDGLKSKNNVSTNNKRTFVPLHRMCSSNVSPRPPLFVLGPEIVFLSGPQKQK